MKKILCLIGFGCLAGMSFGQQKPDPFAGKRKTQTDRPLNIQTVDGRKSGGNTSQNNFTKPFQNLKNSQESTQKNPDLKNFKTYYSPSFLNPVPFFIEGKMPASAYRTAATKPETDYLNQVKTLMRIQKPDEEFVLTEKTEDALKHIHFRMKQVYKGIKIWGSEVVLHTKNGDIQSLNGRYFPTPEITDLKPSISAQNAGNAAFTDAQKSSQFRHLTNVQKLLPKQAEIESELIIYHVNDDPNQAKLAWHLTVRPNLVERYEYFTDAKTGVILEKYATHCTIDGPRTATAADLNGISRIVNTYQVGSSFYMIDASKSMFNASRSTFPGSVVGGIYTVDAANTTGTTLNYVTSTNNSWNNPKAISSQFNAGLVFDYYKNTHGRNSIDNAGGTMYSVINVADDAGKGLDNAYWNGQAMFYGNGRTAFKPLAGSLDVAAHEITHGVIQNSANLEYKGQSGAMNESFADVFGVLLDRNDFLIGEDIILNNSFPSGALRSMSNPNQGGTSDPGYQPKTMTQFVNTTQDNGGVHINSGIPNYAFFLFTTTSGMTREKSEKVYYRALTIYLTSKSQFIDLRVAIVKSAEDLFGVGSAEVNAAKAAFDAVGITEVTSTPPTASTIPYSLPSNPGTDFILTYDSTRTNRLSKIEVNTALRTDLVASKLLNKPSVTDDGSTAYYVTQDGKIRKINLSGTSVTESVVDNQNIWSSVAISKDGSKIAATRQKIDTSIYILNLTNLQWTRFKLYNPTRTQGVNADGVQYADALDWDHTGEFVMYDSFNEIGNSSGGSIEFWDIGFLKVWDNDKNAVGSGEISKLFSGLPEDISVGNPVFSKNSPYVIAFDYIDNYNGTATIYAYNFETGKGNGLYTQDVLGYPSFSRTDDRLLFCSESTTQTFFRIAPLKTDKISLNGSVTNSFLASGFGVWYGNGSRNISQMNLATVTGSPFCGDNSIIVSFTANYPYASGNVFTAQLSNASGSFASPTVLGTLTGTGNGTITTKIPVNVLSGTAYRIRVVSSVPALFGNNNGVNLTMNPKTPQATISLNGFTLTSNVSTGNQWLRDGNTIAGATGNIFIPNIPGTYTVRQSSTACGNTTSNGITVNITPLESEVREGVLVYPNPAEEKLTVEFLNPLKNPNLTLYNLVGQTVIEKNSGTSRQTELNVKALPKGIYFLQIQSDGKTIRRKIIVQ